MPRLCVTHMQAHWLWIDTCISPHPSPTNVVSGPLTTHFLSSASALSFKWGISCLVAVYYPACLHAPPLAPTSLSAITSKWSRSPGPTVAAGPLPGLHSCLTHRCFDAFGWSPRGLDRYGVLKYRRAKPGFEFELSFCSSPKHSQANCCTTTWPHMKKSSQFPLWFRQKCIKWINSWPFW